MKNIGNKIEIALFVVLAAAAVGVAFWRQPAAPEESILLPEPEATATPETGRDINTVGMAENKTIYSEDDPESLVYFYVTVQRGDAGSDTDHSFAEVNSAVRFAEDSHVDNDIYARAIVQVGDADGPRPGMLGYDATASNATIRVRGNSSSVRPQKSYKLDLDDEAGLWRGQSNIALNKHTFDATRLRNKLYFDLLRPVEDISSLRTQFVRLYIKDETAGETTFTDYGLFTQAEVPTKKYLANHGLDSEGYLYKAISFNFEMSEGLKNFDDPAFDQTAFEKILSCKGRQDNQKLIDLVNLIADRTVDINTIVGDYIDRDNYLTWLAYNILLGNSDTTVQNFYLYSPLNSQKWFFIPWDGDNCLHWQEDDIEGLTASYGGWEHGVANYWGVLLHQRFLKDADNRAALAARVDELHETINGETVSALAEQYDGVVRPYVLSMPDFYYLGNTAAERETILAGLGDQVELAYRQFYNSLHELMPFFMYVPEQENGTVRFVWEDAYDFDNQPITYRLRVAATPDFASPAVDVAGLDSTAYEVPSAQLPAGTWYYEVTASTQDGRTAPAMNKIQVSDVYYPGVDRVEVTG
ncbi:CotH kinase family protein [Subdoligranulum variabile]|uniref:CotH protein n=1 Tax=Subdoligranulum variabile DSM 15176 TaxID=411471 RepID=D1PI82_9FIRM|nr:CotH kinase family protein [Subdoligranulum variabile]EFB77596.1 CotH protein [Subdoligranulum variabile DSM 15176]UWP67157.1 CotH kinase family protein [Subdoligranulum variabile]